LCTLPNDLKNPVPLCERIAQLLDVFMPLTRREDLSEDDRATLLAFCMTDHRLQNFAELIHGVDLAMFRGTT
jgi:hypothetical protein